ncbi:SCO0607 family lipoprotein [Streptomyces sp. NPDC056190]|uniref:SCO0607 family lipoprotein n=1 Tax=unclassified Streptomyces TaxID=2593676 RepID=UPI0035DD7910
MPRRISRSTAFRPGRFQAVGAALAGTAVVVALTGCSYQEDVCSRGKYPVLQVNGPGGDCVANGDEPPAEYTRYPEGKVPQQVNDKWDVYWSTRTLDKDGNVIDLPDAY